MRGIRRSISCLTVALAFAAAGQAEMIFVADMTTGQEFTLNGITTTTGDPRPMPFGSATFILNDAMTELTFTGTIFNIDVTGDQTTDTNDNLRAAHIHAGPNVPPATNSVVWGFFGMPFNDTLAPVTTLTPFGTGVGGTFAGTWNGPEGNNTTLADQLANLAAGRAYINFHTIQNPGGEIRGALVLTPEPSTVGLMAVGGLALLLRARKIRPSRE